MSVFSSQSHVVTSVCLASYNGEKYIIEQIFSVLSQLDDCDELIISDNGSSDSTLALIESVTDSRLKLISCNQKGVVNNFENALMHTKGDFIVLCDQDDVWLPGRLQATRIALKNHDLSVVGVRFVDDSLVPLVKYPNTRVPKTSLLSTIAFNGFTGCCMAFRREILELILPFPRSVPMHDWWIALVALGVRAKVCISEEPFILYRRHLENVSNTGGRSSFSLTSKLSMRVFLVLSLLGRLLHIFCYGPVLSNGRLHRSNSQTGFRAYYWFINRLLKNKCSFKGKIQRKTIIENVPRLRFAVFLAAFNGMSFIEEQIKSILFQTNVSVQIFISVDQSSDGTENYLAEWAVSEPRLTLLPFGQRFGSAAPNFYRLFRDVDLTGFDCLSFSDQDDIWHLDKLWRSHCSMMEKLAFGYSSNVTAFWPSGKTYLVNKAQPQRSLDFMFEAAGPGCTYVLKNSLALSIQKMVREADTCLLRVEYHDWLIYAFARANNYPWVIDDVSSMQYRQHANNQIGVNVGWRSYLLRVRKTLGGHGFEQSLLIAGLVYVSSTPVVEKGLCGGRFGSLWLALHANQCRRKRLDQLWFFILCIFFVLAKPVDRDNA